MKLGKTRKLEKKILSTSVWNGKIIVSTNIDLLVKGLKVHGCLRVNKYSRSNLKCGDYARVNFDRNINMARKIIFTDFSI